MKRIFSLILTFAMLLTMLTVSASAAGVDLSADVWDADTVIALGAKAPTKKGDIYEISTPEQLLYLSGYWKTDAPRNGKYVLTKDLDMKPLMDKIATAGGLKYGYMPPIAAIKSGNSEGTTGYFTGTFDGQGHKIENLTIQRTGDKYAGLFGYLGYDGEPATFKNTALLNLNVIGQKNCGGLAGVTCGTVDSVVVTGSLTSEETAGGISGKLKNGTITNCVAIMNVASPIESAGLVGSLGEGATMQNCLAAGTVSGMDAEAPQAGGAVGVLSAADAMSGIVTRQSKVAGGNDTSRLIGFLSGESGLNLTRNYVWKGIALCGNEPTDIPSQSYFSYASDAEILSRAFYEKTVGWDFGSKWTWVGSENAGYPVPKTVAGVCKNLGLETASPAEATIIPSNPVLTAAKLGDDLTVTAEIVGGKASSVSLVCNGKATAMQETDGVYSCMFPATAAGTYTYTIEAKVNGKTITYPYHAETPVSLTISEGKVDGTPNQIMITPGSSVHEMNINYTTDPAVVDTQVWYRAAGASDWTQTSGTSYVSYLTEGFDNIGSHKATVSGLAADTKYEYKVGGTYDGTAFVSDVNSFTTLPDNGSFTFLQTADLQSETLKGYDPFRNTWDQFVQGTLKKQGVDIDMMVLCGDNVVNGYKSVEWNYLFEALGDVWSNNLTAMLPGNHENAGDPTYVKYSSHVNLPNGMVLDGITGTTGYTVIGDACIVYMQSDPYSGNPGANVAAEREMYYQKQTEWAKSIYESTGCKWRLMASHIGTYTSNHDGLVEWPYVAKMCDELGVDLYMNGDDHEYIRATCKDGAKAEIGVGTTYMTCSSCGEKLDKYDAAKVDQFVTVQKDGNAGTQQILSVVTVDKAGIHVTAYQRSPEVNGAIDWSKWDVIDKYDITKSIKGASAPAETAPVAPAKPEETVAPAASGLYTVQKGDCLWTISQKFFGTGVKWTSIYNANLDKIKNPSMISIGLELTIPKAS